MEKRGCKEVYKWREGVQAIPEVKNAVGVSLRLEFEGVGTKKVNS